MSQKKVTEHLVGVEDPNKSLALVRIYSLYLDLQITAFSNKYLNLF